MRTKPRSVWQILKMLFAPAIQDKWNYLFACLANSWIFVFDIYSIITLQHITKAVVSEDLEKIRSILITYSIIFVIYYIYKRIVRHQTRVKIRFSLWKIIWEEYIEKYLATEYTAVEKIGVGRLINIIPKWIDSRRDALDAVSFGVPELVIKIGFALYIVRQMWWEFALFFTVFFFIASFLMIYVNNYTLQARMERKNVEISFSRNFVRLLIAKQEILQSDKQEREKNLANDSLNTQWKMTFKVNNYLRVMYNWPLFAVQGLLIIIIYYTYTNIIAWTFSYELFTALVIMIWYLTQLMVGVTSKYKDLTNNFTHTEKLRDIFEEMPIMEGYYEWDLFKFEKGTIQLQNVTYAYDEDKVFENFDVQIEWWKKIALVGISGGGKSTLAKLVAWYLRPDQWKIIIDWQDLRAISLKSYYKHIWFLTQEPSVFDGTLRDNLTYALVEEEQGTQNLKEQVDRIIKLAKCEFVYEFKNWLETEIGERGIRLSWGQKQRLAIAKIFLKNPEIIILDEPTSALDSFSEDAITEAMHNLFNGRTVVIIAHRLQTVKEADDIILIEKGKIVERGTHKDLVQLNGQYAKMLELQTGF